MNINDLAASRLAAANLANPASSARGSKAVDPNDPVTKALQQATDRLTQQKQNAEVKLSSFGQVQSAVADLETNGRQLGKVSTSETAAEARKVAQNFVNAYNTARTVSNKAVNGTQSAAPQGSGQSGAASPAIDGTLAQDNRARVANNELSRSLDPATRNNLSALGITTNQDGTLKLDAQKFDQAYTANTQQAVSTLNSAGQQAEQTATRQLSSNGSVGRSIDTLNRQVQNLDNQQSNQQALIDTLQQNTDQATNRLNAISASGIAAYQKIFNL